MGAESAERLRWAEATALKVGELLMTRFRTEVGSEDKAAGIVTELDRRAEELFASELEDAFPDDGLLSEEGTGAEGSSGWRWIVDPLDGTTNYVAGLPYFTTSIACLTGPDVQLGVVHCPSMAETFTARRGEGAFGPQGKMCGKTTRNLGETVFLLNKCYSPAERLWGACNGLLAGIRAFRYQGCISLDLAYVAAGRVDGLILLPAEPWDLAAGLAMLEEAGVGYRSLDGGPVRADRRTGIVAAPPALLDEVESLIRVPAESDSG